MNGVAVRAESAPIIAIDTEFRDESNRDGPVGPKFDICKVPKIDIFAVFCSFFGLSDTNEKPPYD